MCDHISCCMIDWQIFKVVNRLIQTHSAVTWILNMLKSVLVLDVTWL